MILQSQNQELIENRTSKEEPNCSRKKTSAGALCPCTLLPTWKHLPIKYCLFVFLVCTIAGRMDTSRTYTSSQHYDLNFGAPVHITVCLIAVIVFLCFEFVTGRSAWQWLQLITFKIYQSKVNVRKNFQNFKQTLGEISNNPVS